MPTRNVVLTDHHEEVIDQLVKSGRYQNASEVMREEGLLMIAAGGIVLALLNPAPKVAQDRGARANV